LAEEDAVIFVHDGVRCLVSADLIHRCYNTAMEKGTAIPAIPSKDSVRLLTEHGNDAVDRKKVMLVQTPQTFLGHILLPVFNTDYKEEFTDEATVAEAHGVKITLTEGEENNIKITRPADITIAEKILNEMAAAH
jgi:2-C-methyl-D-erythritol 4-phosphate cytidylyltransferase